MLDFLFVCIMICCSAFVGFLYGLNVESSSDIKYKQLKLECELDLPRNQECTMVFLPPKKLSSDKTKGEVGHSIPK